MNEHRKKDINLSSVALEIVDAENEEQDLQDALLFIHIDTEFLAAADAGNVDLLRVLIRPKPASVMKNVIIILSESAMPWGDNDGARKTGLHRMLVTRRGADIQQKDYLGRNALHLAVCSDNEDAIILLINAGVETCIKDKLGASPLSLCLMRRPSLRVAQLLFDRGVRILPRASPTDTGLFHQFVMMCEPTAEEAQILKLLVEKGAQINDLGAPGGRQALHFAAMSNNCILIRLLVDLGADLFLTNHRHQTARDVAFIFKCAEAYELLTEMEENDILMSYSEPSNVRSSVVIIAPGAPL